MKTGRRKDKRREKLAKKYKLTKAERRYLTASFLDQLDACKDEASRRILLGVSR
jgi:hypothetical protein